MFDGLGFGVDFELEFRRAMMSRLLQATPCLVLDPPKHALGWCFQMELNTATCFDHLTWITSNFTFLRKILLFRKTL